MAYTAVFWSSFNVSNTSPIVLSSFPVWFVSAISLPSFFKSNPSFLPSECSNSMSSPKYIIASSSESSPCDITFSIYASGFAPANTKLTSLICPCITFGPFCFNLLAYILNDEISPCSTKDFASLAASVLLKVQYAYTPSSLFSNTACPKIFVGSLC